MKTVRPALYWAGYGLMVGAFHLHLAPLYRAGAGIANWAADPR